MGPGNHTSPSKKQNSLKGKKMERVEQLEAQLAASKTHADLLQKRLDAQGSAKIPTAAALKDRGKGIRLTRAEQLHLDLETAIGMGPEKMAKFYEELQRAIDNGLNIQEELAKGKKGKVPNLRYLIAVENKIHAYIKRGKRKMRTKDGMGTKMAKVKGGFCKGLSKDLIKFTKSLLVLMGREKVEWDERIPVPGLDRLDIQG